MRHLLILTACLALAVPSLATPALAAPALAAPAPAQGGKLPNAGSGGKPARTFVLRNDSGTRIVAAHVTATNGKRVDLLREMGPLTNAEGRDVLVPGGTCIRSVVVTLQGGKDMAANPGHDCDHSLVEVGHNRITLTSSAAKSG